MLLNPITVLFRILNVIALIAVAIYFFKRYAYPTIREGQDQKAQAKRELEQEKERLAVQQSEIDDAIRAQEVQRTVLLERLKLWLDAFEHEKHVLAHERHRLAEQFSHQMAERVDRAQHERMQRLVIPQALAQARQQLRTTFANSEQGNQYLTTLITTMEKQ